MIDETLRGLGTHEIVIKSKTCRKIESLWYNPLRRRHANLVLCGISDQTLAVCEGDITGCGSITLVIGNNLHFSMLEYADTRIGRSQINTNCRFVSHFVYK